MLYFCRQRPRRIPRHSSSSPARRSCGSIEAIKNSTPSHPRSPPSGAWSVKRSASNRWVYEYFEAADSLDLKRLLPQHTDDVRLTFANYPTVTGKEKFSESIGGLWARIKGMSHSMTGAWSLDDSQVGIAESIVTYTRKDGSF
jgi:hypothetical protein